MQALAALEADDAYPAVIVCPASLKLNWAREIERWLPHRSLTVVSGTSATAAEAEIVVINYEIVHAHRVRLALRKPKALVLDESHYVKNPRAKRTQAVRRLAEALPDGALKLALTGTPVMNHAGRADRPAADPGPAVASSAPAPASRAASRARAPRSASTGTCGAPASCAG